MVQCFRLLLVVGVLIVTPAYGNGWSTGQNFVPVIMETIATDENGNQLTISPGTPVYIKEGDGALETWLHWDERPFERRAQIARAALPQVLEGFRAYQRGEFVVSARLFETEAKAESQPLVRSWKYILAGHSHLAEDLANTDKAVALYRLAAQESSGAFQANAQYFIFRVFLNQEEYGQAHDELKVLRSLSKDGYNARNLLFKHYAQDSLAAWGAEEKVNIEGAMNILNSMITAKSAFDSRGELESDSERAEVHFQLAMAME